ncbi:protein gar2 [Ananas comosus]|uniref:Nucleolin 2 n=1 Tax=Ananas comosus TaxID=4615 RepID=A0A199V5J6_ANACO|nr:protein gar2 [Ananas comosus]OAY72130.1 Nucleolin 2 [Ananas comosus]
MVLSHKKLKQKLRSLLAHSAAGESEGPREDDAAKEEIDQQVESIKELLGSKSRGSKPSKRPRRKKKPLPSSEESKSSEGDEGISEGVKENGGGVGVEEEKKSGKRKREEVDGDKEPKKKKKKKKKLKEKQKKKDKNTEKEKMRKGEEDEKGVEGNEKVVVESIQSINTAESEQNVKKVYVGGIPYYSTEDDIKSFFEGCGTVTEIDCMTFPESGKFRGIAILSFKTEAAANRALALDGADMGGFYLKIQPYKSNHTQKSDFAPQIVEGYNRIYVGNLSWDITEDDLRNFFSNCKISSIRFGTDKETGDFKGYAHVDFADNESLLAALKLDQKVVYGRPVRITCATPKRTISRREVETKSASKPNNVEESGDGASSGKKKKRRTCYVCGTPGHLSSSCPQKKAGEGDGSSGVTELKTSRKSIRSSS